MLLSEPADTSADVAVRQLTLVVDLDGTLTATNTLVECFVRLARQQPLAAVAALRWLLQGRAVFKRRVFEAGRLDARCLPWREDVVDWLRGQKADGRRIVLATAADQAIADAVAGEIGVFDAAYGSDGQLNLKGAAKRDHILHREGADFVYAGDSRADLPVWQAARAAVLVDVSAGVAAQVRAHTPVEREFAGMPAGWRVWLRALRLHQWLKNVLVFVPLFTSFSFWDPSAVMAALLAFVAFGLMASGTYVFNDLWDLDSDRQHPRKRHRPFASGALPIAQGVLVALGLMAAALGVATLVSGPFLAVLCVYFVATTSYSLVLKRYVLMDVMMLASLYTLRVLAGAFAIGVDLTPWLLSFSMFVFLSLALVKRCAELVAFQRDGRDAAHGRDYRVGDLVVLWPLGASASMAAVVVFGLFVSAADSAGRYGNAQLLWLVGVGLIYWLGRLWIKTARGEMDDDPIIFTLRDFGTRSVLLAMMALTVVAHLS
jgi:4-hydroxybenzoate polyprenyltransferase/phosphoserine phosphatase